jgi:non-specific serine/threonine protein kinase
MSETSSSIHAELVLSPAGHLYFNTNSQATEELTIKSFDKIKQLFDRGSDYGLLHLGIQEFATALPMSFLFWQKFSRRFIGHLCKLSQGVNAEELKEVKPPDQFELQEFISQALLIKGFEYLTPDLLIELWNSLERALILELKLFSGTVQEYLNQYNPKWSLVGRICFHLAEKKNDEQYPFAFLATYTVHHSEKAAPQHLPLKRALQEYAGEGNKQLLLALLTPMQKAASLSPFVQELVASGRIFQPLPFTIHEAHGFLQSIPFMEASGVMVRVPNWWNSQKPARPKVMVTIGDKQKGGVGLDAMLDFQVQIALGDDHQLTHDEWQHLLNSHGNLVKIKEQWVEIDREKLKSVLDHWNKLKNLSKEGMTMGESLRLLAGSGSNLLKQESELSSEDAIEWSMVKAGDWLKGLLDDLRNPSNAQACQNELQLTLKRALQASLRPYQTIGVQWLWQLYQLKLGGCLADDMGLGKTIQILSLLLHVKEENAKSGTTQKPHLLVVPASLIGNWQAEAMRFAPTLNLLIAHSSVNGDRQILDGNAARLASTDLIITTYAFVHRLAWLKEINWDLIILDEAQLIKNPGTKQTKAVKALKGEVRLILTGTPIENKLADLWSLFDFTSPGLLGSAKTFTTYSKKAGKEIDAYGHFVSTLRTLTQPYILRRLKSDKKIIADLPDKTEMQVYCALSKEQAKLYTHSVEELMKSLEDKELDNMKRRGLVLSYLMRFKQICNHPAQWLGYGDYSSEASGKFMRLREICEEIAAKQEKVLVFTQFREIIPVLASVLSEVFGREGLILHGETAIKKRAELVESFQQEQGPPFFILSLKAGGTGLTLTRASHVIHFDRWWNPAVENQATDRAYRIGQKHPVLVHKFICRGTVEEKIDAMITAKKGISQELLEGGNELLLTEMSSDELLKMVSLDIQQALEDF